MTKARKTKTVKTPADIKAITEDRTTEVQRRLREHGLAQGMEFAVKDFPTMHPRFRDLVDGKRHGPDIKDPDWVKHGPFLQRRTEVEHQNRLTRSDQVGEERLQYCIDMHEQVIALGQVYGKFGPEEVPYELVAERALYEGDCPPGRDMAQEIVDELCAAKSKKENDERLAKEKKEEEEKKKKKDVERKMREERRMAAMQHHQNAQRHYHHLGQRRSLGCRGHRFLPAV